MHASHDDPPHLIHDHWWQLWQDAEEHFVRIPRSVAPSEHEHEDVHLHREARPCQHTHCRNCMACCMRVSPLKSLPAGATTTLNMQTAQAMLVSGAACLARQLPDTYMPEPCKCLKGCNSESQ